MAKHKKQHYLPEFYLNGFAKNEKINNNKTKILWIYDKKTKVIKTKSPESIAWRPYEYSYEVESGIYNHNIENQISKIEDKAKRLLDKIDNYIKDKFKQNTYIELPLSKSDKELLIYFVFLMFKRIPSTMDVIQKGMEEIFKELSLKYGRVHTPQEIKRESLRIFCELGTDTKYNYMDKFYSKNLLFVFIKTESTSFITTDKPVTIWRKKGSPLGITYEDAEIWFPLNCKCLLVFHGKGNDSGISKLSNSKQIFDKNLYLSHFSKKLIISRDKKLLEKIVSKL